VGTTGVVSAAAAAAAAVGVSSPPLIIIIAELEEQHTIIRPTPANIGTADIYINSILKIGFTI
jgi:hypothetical protein